MPATTATTVKPSLFIVQDQRVTCLVERISGEDRLKAAKEGILEKGKFTIRDGEIELPYQIRNIDGSKSMLLSSIAACKYPLMKSDVDAFKSAVEQRAFGENLNLVQDHLIYPNFGYKSFDSTRESANRAALRK